MSKDNSNDFSLDTTSTFGFPTFLTKDGEGDNMYSMLNLNISPIILVFFLVILIIFYIIFNTFVSNSNSNEAPKGFGILFIIIWCIFLILIFGNALKYLFDLNLKAIMKDLMKPIPQLNLHLNSDKGKKYDDYEYGECEGEKEEEEEGADKKEVYHIPRNIYTYDNAKALCKAFDGRLAKINEIEEAYDSGAEWCSYGWSDKQMALFPTQYKSWKKLQKQKGRENDCGRPGINGGYMKNTSLKYGVNCYGKKPKITNIEKQLMQIKNPVPVSEDERNFNKKVDYYKHRLPSILLSPHDKKKWSKI